MQAFEELCSLEPRLEELAARIAGVTDDRRAEYFCANEVWINGGFKAWMSRLVGFQAGEGQASVDARLKTCDAYDIAYRALYDALPPCRACMCVAVTDALFGEEEPAEEESPQARSVADITPAREIEIHHANILRVRAGTTGPRGGDSGHGGRTFFEIQDLGGTDIHVTPIPRGVRLEVGGDAELHTLTAALEFILRTWAELGGRKP